MKAICGFIFPVATAMKSLSLKEKVASGFPSYAPKSAQKKRNDQNQINRIQEDDDNPSNYLWKPLPSSNRQRKSPHQLQFSS